MTQARKRTSLYGVPALLAAICLSAGLLFLIACGGSDSPAPSPATESPATPTVPPPTQSSDVGESPTPAPGNETEEPAPAPTATEVPTTIAPTATEVPPPPAPTATEAAPPTSEVSGEPRKMGEYEGVTFVVSEGSEATFTVEEQLARLPLPNDAVMRTSALSGEVHLDGGASTVQVDLHQLSSDQAYRDRYVRNRMFRDSPIATFTVDGGQPVPEGLALGQEVTAQVTGSLQVRDVTVPMMFEVEARDDGDVMFIVGRTTFTWDQLDIPPPEAPVVASIEDEVRVEVLLALTPREP